MKKLLLVIIASLLTSSNIYADEAIYISGGIGASFIQKTKIEGVKAKSKEASPLISLAIGYDTMDNFRTELSYIHFFDPKVTTKNDSTIPTASNKVINKSSQSFSIDALLVNGYYDIFDTGPAKFFVGAGVGVASVKSRGSSTQTTTQTVEVPSPLQANNLVINGVKVDTRSTQKTSTSTSSVAYKGETATNFAYNLIVGTAFAVNEDTTFDFKYLFNDCGKAKKFKEQKSGNARFRTHSLVGSFRFKL